MLRVQYLMLSHRGPCGVIVSRAMPLTIWYFSLPIRPGAIA